jgi:hypothetical protein
MLMIDPTRIDVLERVTRAAVRRSERQRRFRHLIRTRLPD